MAQGIIEHLFEDVTEACLEQALQSVEALAERVWLFDDMLEERLSESSARSILREGEGIHLRAWLDDETDLVMRCRKQGSAISHKFFLTGMTTAQCLDVCRLAIGFFKQNAEAGITRAFLISNIETDSTLLQYLEGSAWRRSVVELPDLLVLPGDRPLPAVAEHAADRIVHWRNLLLIRTFRDDTEDLATLLEQALQL